MTKQKDGSTETLTGVVTAIEWDDDEVTKVSLFATDDQEYHIENSHKFFELVQNCIEATGRVQRGKKSFRSIHIKKYRVL